MRGTLTCIACLWLCGSTTGCNFEKLREEIAAKDAELSQLTKNFSTLEAERADLSRRIEGLNTQLSAMADAGQTGTADFADTQKQLLAAVDDWREKTKDIDDALGSIGDLKVDLAALKAQEVAGTGIASVLEQVIYLAIGALTGGSVTGGVAAVRTAKKATAAS